MKILIRWCFVFFVISFCFISQTFAEKIEVKSYADSVLKQDVLNTLTVSVVMQAPKCSPTLDWSDVVKTDVPATNKPHTKWQETWYVKACDQLMGFIIDFEPAPTEGTYFFIKVKQ